MREYSDFEKRMYLKIQLPLLRFLGSGIFSWVPDKLYFKIRYLVKMRCRLNLKNPIKFNAKLQWIKLYDRRPECSNMADKYEARKIIAEKIGEEYLVPLTGVYNSFSDIDFDTVPDKFVIKCTHDTSSIVICYDKQTLDIPKLEKRMNKRLKTDYYKKSREWPYENIKPRLIIEPLLDDGAEFNIVNYKIYCFSGEPKMIRLYWNGKRHLLDPQWKPISGALNIPGEFLSSIKKPAKLDKMLEIASVLSEGFPFIRIDLYYVHGKIYCGEMTFFPASGYDIFLDEERAKEVGSWIKLPPKKSNN